MKMLNSLSVAPFATRQSVERSKMNELKIPEIIGDIEIDLNQHEVLMVMRGNRPPMLVVSGNLLNGISQVVATSRLFENRVTVTFNEYINSNPFPYDDFDVLQTLLSENPKKLSARDIVIEKRLGEHSYQDRQKNYAEQ